MVFTIINKKDWSSINSELFVTFYARTIWKCAKKGEHFLKTLNLKTFIQWNLFSIYKNSIFHLCPNVARFFKNSLYGRIRHLKKKYSEEENFEVARTRKWGKCGLDEILLWLTFLPSFNITTKVSILKGASTIIF